MPHSFSLKFSLLEGIYLATTSGLFDVEDFPEFFGRGDPFDDRGAFERGDRLQRDFDQERRDLRAADELLRRDDNRRRDFAAKQDPNDDDMTRIRRTLTEMPMEEMIELINNPEVRVTRRGITSSRRPSGRDVIRRSGQFAMQGFALPSKKPRKKNKKHCKNLSQCLRQANAELRTKRGAIRKGKTQADIMRRAQKLLRKMS
jgi:hypothetical protein